MAVGVPDQRSDRPLRGAAYPKLGEPGAGKIELAARPDRAPIVHHIRDDDAPDVGAGPARRQERVAPAGRIVRGRRRFARPAGATGEPGAVAAYTAVPAAPARDLAQRRARRISWRRACVADHLPSHLPGGGARALAGRNRLAALAAADWTRRRFAVDW